MVVIFLLLTLATGIYYSYNNKSTTIREYAIGNKTFSTATLVATLLATAYGGGALVYVVEEIHSGGLYWVIIAFIGSFNIWVISPLALRMGPFMKHLSMAETLGSVYGRYARIITALSGICASIATIALQINVMSLVIGMCVDLINYRVITILATLILILYSTFGGIRAVTLTDVFQFLTFSIIIPLLTWFIFINAGNPFPEVISFLQTQEKFQFSTVFRFDTNLVGMVALLLSYLLNFIKPTTIQRIYMSSGPIQAKKVFFYSGIACLFIDNLIILIGLFVFVWAPNLPMIGVWGYVMEHIPPIFQGFVTISLLAMAMSTPDSALNSCSVIVSHDILESVKFLKVMFHPYQIRLVRITSIAIGIFAMVLAFYCRNLLDLLKLGLGFSIPIITAPFLLSVFGFRGTSRTALIGMATGVLTILAWNKCVEPGTGIDGSFISMLANGLAMMVAHYFLKQPESAGWVGTDDTLKQIQQENARRKAERKERIKNFWTDKKNTLAKLQPNHYTLTFIGFYTVISNLLTYFIASISGHSYWLICQTLLGAFF